MRKGDGIRVGLGAIIAGLLALTATDAALAQSRDGYPFLFNPFYSEPPRPKPAHPKPRYRKPAPPKPAHAKPAHTKPAPAEPPPVLTPIALQTPAALSRDVAYARFIALIRADLAMGDELVKRRDWELAHRHFMFPLEEIYGVIRGDLRTYKTPAFDGALRSLASTVAARRAKTYPKALAAVEKALAAADANLRARQPNWARFVLQVSVATLKTAPEEYDDALENGRFVRSIGYQTARGIVISTQKMLDGVAVDLGVKNPDAFRELQDGMAELRAAFPTVNAPKEPVVDAASMSATVAKIEMAARKLM
jgi:hypothetical protein